MKMKIDDLFDTKGVTVAYAHPTPRLTSTAWSCANYDPDVFHPADQDSLAEAQSVCAGCEVRTDCFALGVSRGEWGVWGGVLLEGGKPLDKVKVPGRPRKSTAA